nr:retrovirus-related Pol polyprotein from transposon TNT 1-94 [Tanacetum cinerariifolium]
MMHTSEDFTLDQIQKHLRIKEETRMREKNLNGASSSRVNYVDSGKNNKGNNKKRKGTWSSSKDNKNDKKSLSEVVCYKCDDILIVGTNIEGINETKKFMSSCFQMKDINEVYTILGIKVKRHSGGYALDQCHYIDKIKNKFQHLNIKEANTIYESSCKLVENDGRAVAQIEYASAIGCLISDSKSTTGWIFTLGGGAVCWGSKKQTCITHSTMKAEFLALAVTRKEAEWLRNMFLDIELWPQPMPAMSLHCDSQSTLSKAYNGKSRHISLRHAYIKELISNRIITIEYIRFCKNLMDPFIKGLPKDIVLELQERCA